MTVSEAGRVETTAKVENGILGISNSFTRYRGTARECVHASIRTISPHAHNKNRSRTEARFRAAPLHAYRALGSIILPPRLGSVTISAIASETQNPRQSGTGRGYCGWMVRGQGYLGVAPRTHATIKSWPSGSHKTILYPIGRWS
jgi:hypothetical protein